MGRSEVSELKMVKFSPTQSHSGNTEAHIDELAHIELQAILDLWAVNEPTIAAYMLAQFLDHVHVIPVYGEKVDAHSTAKS